MKRVVEKAKSSIWNKFKVSPFFQEGITPNKIKVRQTKIICKHKSQIPVYSDQFY